MKHPIQITGMIVSGMLAILIYSGCKKDSPSVSNEAPSVEMRIANSNALAQASFEDAAGAADEAMLQTSASGTSNRLSAGQAYQTSCATITIDLNSNPHVMTIDYGSSDCLGRDGNYRKGIITVSWSGQALDSGAYRTVTFTDYYFNFNRINGNITVTNNGLNTSGNRNYSLDVDGTVDVSALYSTSGTSDTIHYTAHWNKEKVQGAGTFWLHDDVYLIRGSSSGNTLSTSFTAESDSNSPLKKETGFPHFTSGILNISSNGTSFSVDYGYLNGTRDNLAMVTSGGQTYIIRLGK